MKRILVCEDEDVIREFVVINLKRAGYDVVDVNCGEEALRVYESENGNFDIALLDVMMPGIDGFQVCKELREKSSRMGIIMLIAVSKSTFPSLMERNSLKEIPSRYSITT